MQVRLTVGEDGRIVVPQSICDELHLLPGDTLELSSQEGAIILRPIRKATFLQEEHGIWVYRIGQPVPPDMVDNTLQQVREERERQIMGDS